MSDCILCKAGVEHGAVGHVSGDPVPGGPVFDLAWRVVSLDVVSPQIYRCLEDECVLDSYLGGHVDEALKAQTRELDRMIMGDEPPPTDSPGQASDSVCD